MKKTWNILAHLSRWKTEKWYSWRAWYLYFRSHKRLRSFLLHFLLQNQWLNAIITKSLQSLHDIYKWSYYKNKLDHLLDQSLKRLKWTSWKRLKTLKKMISIYLWNISTDSVKLGLGLGPADSGHGAVLV